MASKKYNPAANYIVTSGILSVKGDKKSRTLYKPGDTVKLSHLLPHQIAFLVEVRQVIALAPTKEKKSSGDSK